jgi:hypothetical protein
VKSVKCGTTCGLPVYVSAASASILLRKAGKVKKIKWENGRVFDFTVA